MIGSTRWKVINKACKVNDGFSFSYSESHSTKHLRMTHWLLFILSRKNIWDNQQQMTFALIQSNLPNSALMEKSKSQSLMQWDKSAVVQVFTWTVCEKPHRTLFNLKISCSAAKPPHIFPDCFKIILSESRVTDNIQHDHVEFRCIQ